MGGLVQAIFTLVVVACAVFYITRTRRLILIRHGESEANVDRNITAEVPDHSLHITPKGRQQALQAGENLKQIVGDESVTFVVSPYVRTIETFNGVVQAFGGMG